MEERHFHINKCGNVEAVRLYFELFTSEFFKYKRSKSEAEKQQILIKGNILIKYKDALIEAPEGQVENDENGKPVTELMRRKVKITWKGDE